MAFARAALPWRPCRPMAPCPYLPWARLQGRTRASRTTCPSSSRSTRQRSTAGLSSSKLVSSRDRALADRVARACRAFLRERALDERHEHRSLGARQVRAQAVAAADAQHACAIAFGWQFEAAWWWLVQEGDDPFCVRGHFERRIVVSLDELTQLSCGSQE